MQPSSARDILLQARAVILCGLPYVRVEDQQITRRARLGKDTWVSVTYAAVGDNAVLPYGSDRALLAWIQTKAYPTGEVSFNSITEFLDAFDLNHSGPHYNRFMERLERLKALSIRVKVENESEEMGLSTVPIKRYFTPKSKTELREQVSAEMKETETGQMSLMQPQRYGFVMDQDFMRYFEKAPIPLPLPLMREFKSTCLAWDLASLILYRCGAARTGATFPWTDLVSQLGTKDSNKDRLAAKFRATFYTIREYYPDFPAHLLSDGSGVWVEPWRPLDWERG